MFTVIKDYGFVLKEDDIKDLFLKNKNIKDVFLKSVENNTDYETMLDLADELGFMRFFTEDSGFAFFRFQDEGGREDIDYGTVFILSLDRDSLFQKYEDYDDIYAEVYTKLKDKGFDIDIDYVKQFCGILEGVEYYD